MKASIESTDIITTLDGVPARVWRGVTEAGVPFVAFIHRVSVEVDEDATEFEQLVAQAQPRELSLGQVFRAFSTRML